MAFPVEPNPEFFTKPKELVPGFGTTVTDEGHVFGYLALFNARLIGSGIKNKRPPKSNTNYAHANAYQTKCSDGSIVRTGVLAGDGGHHRMGDFKRTQAAYADTKHQIARVVYGEDKHGVWFTGALNSDCDAELAQKVRGSGVSGHWEPPVRGQRPELLGSCLVNVPGFSQAADHRIVASASFTDTGGIIVTPHVEESTEDNPPVDLTRITAAGSSIMAAAASELKPVKGVLATLGTPTPDGRQVNEVTFRTLPLPLFFKKGQGGWGHDGAIVIGRIDNINVNGSFVEFEGMVEMELEDSEVAEAVANLKVLGISMDGAPAEGVEVMYEYDEYGWPTLITFPLYEISGATLTSSPAMPDTMGVQIGEDETIEPANIGTVPTTEDADEAVDDEVVDTDVDDEEDSGVAASAGTSEYTTIKVPVRWS